MTDLMVCNGLNHKNCQSWSRWVIDYLNSSSLHLRSIFSSRCEQDSKLSRNSTYYGSCVVGVGVGVPQRQIERETIA